MNYELNKALEFLQAFRPQGIHLLTAVRIDKKSIETYPFVAGKEDAGLLEFLQAKSTDEAFNWNLYFSVNPVIRPIRKKAERENIARMEYLHVDIDQRPGEDLVAEKQRALKLLTETLPAGVPPPTWIIDSGGGIHAYWKLRTPLEIDGQVAAYEEAARYNMQLETLFGADHCHNVDRIMRLPGTINWPDAKKVEKGRKPSLPYVITYEPDRVYDLAQFTPAPLVQGEEFGFSGGTVEVSGNIGRLDNVDALELSQKCKQVIVQGHDPDDPGRWPSRSEPLFWVCCEMVRAGCTDDTIYSVITDEKFGISESVLGKGRSAHKYAIRQIEQAREAAIDPWLMKLNSRHAVIGSVDGRCRILSEELDDAAGRSTLTYQSFEDFRNRYMNERVEVKIEKKDGEQGVAFVPLGKWWTEHAQRRQYDGVVFAPGGDVKGHYNLWKGFACDARPGSCELFMQHVRSNLCHDSDELFKYVVGWMAYAVQHPDEPGHVAIVLRGRKGTGKGRFANVFGALFGRHFLRITNSKHLIGSFNAHLRDCVVLFADEAFAADNRQHESVLKTLITEDYGFTEGKGANARQTTNHLHIIMASNEDWVVPASSDERRYLMLDVADDHLQDLDYFRAIDKEQSAGGREALLHYLMNYDLSEYEPRKVPRTAALMDQQIRSLGTEAAWWFHKLQDGEILEGEGWPDEIRVYDIVENFAVFAQRAREAATSDLGKFIARAIPADWVDKLIVQRRGSFSVRDSAGMVKEVKKTRFWRLPKLEVARRIFEQNFLGGKCAWPTINVEGTVEGDEPF